MSSEIPRVQASIPAGFEQVEFSVVGADDVEHLMRAYIPDAEHFPVEVGRLSQQATSEEPFVTKWNDVLQTVLKYREKWMGQGSVRYTIRELHDATLPAEDSLLQTILATVQPPRLVEEAVITPLQYLVYDYGEAVLRRFTFDSYGTDVTEAAMQQAADLMCLTGEDAVSGKELTFFYQALCIAAGEKVTV